MVDSMIGKKVKVSLKNGRYYKGLVLSQGDDFLTIRDLRDNIVHVRLDFISEIEEVGE